MAERIWRCQDDDGAAGSADASLPYRRDRQRVVSLPAQYGGRKVEDQGAGTEQTGQAGRRSRTVLTAAALGILLRATPATAFPAHLRSQSPFFVQLQKTSSNQTGLRYTYPQPSQ